MTNNWAQIVTNLFDILCILSGWDAPNENTAWSLTVTKVYSAFNVRLLAIPQHAREFSLQETWFCLCAFFAGKLRTGCHPTVTHPRFQVHSRCQVQSAHGARYDSSPSSQLIYFQTHRGSAVFGLGKDLHWFETLAAEQGNKKSSEQIYAYTWKALHSFGNYSK